MPYPPWRPWLCCRWSQILLVSFIGSLSMQSASCSCTTSPWMLMPAPWPSLAVSTQGICIWVGSSGAGPGWTGSGFQCTALQLGDSVRTQSKKASSSCVAGHQDGFTLDCVAQNIAKQVNLIKEWVALLLMMILKDSEANQCIHSPGRPILMSYAYFLQFFATFFRFNILKICLLTRKVSSSLWMFLYVFWNRWWLI